MKIRKATMKDIDQIVELSKELCVDHERYSKYYALRKNKKEVKRLHKKYFGENIRKRTSIFLVVEDNTKLVGYAMGKIAKDPPIMRIVNHGELAEIYVQSRYRGKRLGSKLIQEILKWFKKRKLKRVVVLVDAKNKIAKKAYKKLGFQEHQEKYHMYI